MTSIPFWQVDAFTDQPFTGNPAAVCLLASEQSDTWMQKVAAEMNLSETAFVVPGNTASEFRLRWFTPNVEVDLCGHATLAAAHTLFEQSRVDSSVPIRFHTNSGVLTCSQEGDLITLDFPSTPPVESIDDQIVIQAQAAIGMQAVHFAGTRFDMFLVASDPQTVRDLQPNFDRLAQIDVRGFIVTAQSHEKGIDFISRFFAPRCGINEDPVTGSAHCALAPYWAAELHRETLIGYQASRRGGTVRSQVIGDRVKLSGQAITILEGNIIVGP